MERAATQHLADLEAQVEVQGGRVVKLDDEPRHGSKRMRSSKSPSRP
jgi:hypothetical protein